MSRTACPARTVRTLLAVVALGGLTLGCSDGPTTPEGDPPAQLTHKPGHGGGGQGGGGSTSPTASFLLPAPGADDGLYSDNGDPFSGEPFDPNGVDLIVDCPREFVLKRPESYWPVENEEKDEDEVHCSGKDGFSRLDLNDLGILACSDPEGCPIGTSGHGSESGVGFSNDLNYYFRVKTGPGKGHFAAYNVVWIRWNGEKDPGLDNGGARFTIDGTADTDDDGVADTACRWHVWGSTAEFWDGNGQRDGVQPVALDVRVEREDLTCP